MRPTAVPSSAVAHLRTLVNLVLDDTWQRRSTQRTAVASSLRTLHSALAETDDEFGHRVFYEGLRFAAALEAVGVTSRNPILDRLILLKVLPRIHGSRRRAEPGVLRGSLTSRPTQTASHLPHPQPPAQADPALPMTAAKVARMLRAAEIHQYISFTD